MGQLFLGFRSLLLKFAVFVVLAALLAWALGGTLWPRPVEVNIPYETVRFQGESWHWRLIADEKAVHGVLIWRLVKSGVPDDDQPFAGHHWREKAGPLVASETLFVGGRLQWGSDANWKIISLGRSGDVAEFSMPDRLAVEQQLARIAAGLPIQDRETILRERPAVLDPRGNSADQEGTH